ncbi:MAG: hypothetical protein NZ553_17270 [Caldilinea sp.]|nr:hypothetical protein [Caldilinea sp.]MDW8442233.1 hypothetical protein [Caldilineaceae bacterium]
MEFSEGRSVWLRFGLELLVLLSLALNVVILLYAWRLRSQVVGLRTTVSGMLQRAIVDLQGFENLSMHFRVQVDDVIPVRTLLPVHNALDVVVNTEIPVRQTMQSDVIFNTPLLNTKVPISVTVPIDLAVPVDLRLPVELDAHVPVNLDIPVKLDVPVAVKLAETELGTFVEQVRSGLGALKNLLDNTSFLGR